MESDDNRPVRNPRRPFFRPFHDHVLRAILLIAGAAFVLLLVLSAWYWQTSSWQWVGMAPDQPVQFSHKHHVSQLGIDCRYCHTGVESSSFAGVPPTETCMTCHSQLWTQAALLQPVRTSAETNRPLQWRRVTDIPNYVYFNHSVHINRGVACVTCHGRVDQMPMTYQAIDMKMKWCLQCHRNPEPRLVPTSQVTNPVPDIHAAGLPDWHTGPLAPLTAIQKSRLTNCSTCHR
jgi:hypothetical protein